MATNFPVRHAFPGQPPMAHTTTSGGHVLQFQLRHVSEEQYAIALGVAGVDQVTMIEGGDETEMVVQVSDGFDPRTVRTELVDQLRTAALGL
ncbi:MAG: hypothetical protein GF331_12355 [Chitinivibrionales bacterium]|nr:hypothetical protein [Chitinivibrionales bacterium]